MSIADNIRDIKASIDKAKARAMRNDEVLLLAVTKLHEPYEIDEAAAAGITDIGENKVQEIISKYDQVNADLRWHLIGHLQTNKVKYIIDKVCMIHSVDSLHLALEIEKRAADAGLTMDILVQVNAAEEKSKSGVKLQEANGLIDSILESCPHIYVKGLMEVAPAADDPENVRHVFRDVKDLFDKIKREKIHPNLDMKWLSMGMSSDYEVAVEEGSNIVRIGTAIFGKRDYEKEKAFNR